MDPQIRIHTKMSWIRNTGVQAMVEFRDLETAIRARKELHGCDIYSGCCTIKMEYAKTERLNVRQNDEKTWDFTADFSNKAIQHRGHDMGASQRLEIFIYTFVLTHNFMAGL
jgi:hypothetical protein